MDIVAYQYTIQKMVYLGLILPYTLVISSFQRLLQEFCIFQERLNYMVILCLRKNAVLVNDL